ncbi:MAG: hypothetical protein ACWGN7_01755 [Thermodesulfovibrionales bacterium]
MKRLLFALACSCILAAFSGQAHAIHQTSPSETQRPDAPAMPFQVKTAQEPQQSDAVQALLNILDRKGLVTKEEFREELEKMKGQR